MEYMVKYEESSYDTYNGYIKVYKTKEEAEKAIEEYIKAFEVIFKINYGDFDFCKYGCRTQIWTDYGRTHMACVRLYR